MTQETDYINYTECVVDLMMQIKEHSARPIALDLWKYYPMETRMLYAALAQTQHTRKICKLEGG